MLKELTLLMIVLWGSQGMPTPAPQEQDLRGLSELYCKAEALLQKYKSVDNKVLPSQARPTMASVFSQPGCNFTKAADECQILRAFNALFLWLKSTYPKEGLLEPVMDSFTHLIDSQYNYVNHTCLEGASDEMPQINCTTYSKTTEEATRENMFHYIFELYRNHTKNLWSIKFQKKVPSKLCGSGVY